MRGPRKATAAASVLPARRIVPQPVRKFARELAIQGSGEIAIVTDAASSPFGGYLAEILTAEGVRDFTVSSVASLTAIIQSGPRAILLAPATLTSDDVAALETYVASGGGLIAFRPDSALDTLLGVSSQGGTVGDGYVRITNEQHGAGLYSDTIQFHGTSNRYSLNGAEQIAELYSSRTSTTGLPAATLATSGAGQAAMFSYDLAHSVALTRQGDPAQADQDTDGDGVIRSIDIYRNWTDLERSHVPQADIQQRLLVRLIDAVAGYPTPRLWYYPGTAPSVFVPTGDAHGNPESYFQALVDAFSQRAIGMTFYVPPASPAASSVSQWISQGFDFSVHPYVDQGYGAGYSANVNDFVNDYGFNPTSARTHQVRWTGWSSAAEIESQFGIELDFNSYQWGAWLTNSSGYARGYLNGGGVPMRFAAANGAILPIYQQHTNLVDEQIAPEIGFSGFSLSQALAASQQTIDDCIDQFHTPITTQFHVDYFNFGDVNSWVLGTTDYALQRGAAPLTAAEWLAFIKSRAATSISGVAWTSNTLSFSVASGGGNQTVLIPLNHLGAALTGVSRNGSAIGYSVLTVDGRSMAAIPASSGAYDVVYEADTTAPVITNVNAAPDSEAATITWTTDEAATSLVEYGTTASLGSEESVPGFSTSHSVTLSNLTASTGYFYRVTSEDASGNSSSSAIEEFTTAQAGAPTVTSISPAVGQSGASQSVTITGANFVDGATAELGTTQLENVIVANPTTIQATVPATLPVGQHDLTITNPDQQSATLPNAFTMLAAPPAIESVSPPVVPVGQQISLSGTGFINGATIRIGATAATNVTVISSTSATAVVPLSLAAGTYDVTITNPDAQSDTLVDALTVSELPTVGHTTVADFSPGAFTDTETASGGDAGDGAVVLASSGWTDSFDQPSLDPSKWTTGTWVAGGSTSISSGSLSVVAAWVRSELAIDRGNVTARIAFPGQAWVNFGFSRTDELDNPWFLFGVPGWDTSQVYIRYNFNGGFANIPLPGLIGAPHDYAIVLGIGVVRFLVDGEEVHQVAAPALNPLATWISSGTTSSQLTVDSVEINTYAQQGAYLSPTLDAGQYADWQQLIIGASSVPATSFTARARTSPSGASWSAWSADLSNFPATLSLPVGRYLQYELNLLSDDGTATPVIGSVSGSYSAASGPSVGEVIVTPTAVTLDAGATQQFSAQVLDTNGDPVPGAPVTWSVVNGGGSIDQNGLFTAGTTGGTYVDTVVASSDGVTDTASVTVEVAPAPQVFDASPPVALVGDTITVTGQDFAAGAQVQVGSTPATGVNVINSTSLTFNVPALADGTYSITVTNPDNQFGTLLNALTISSLNWRTHTTLSDFQAGAHSGTEALQGGDAGDGAVGLSNQGAVDEFDGASLNGSLWHSGFWDAGGSLSVGGGQLTVLGGWVRGTSSFTSGTATGRLTFSSTAWQNFGLSRVDDLDNPWFLFGVPGWDTSQVYIRYNFNGGQADIPLAGLIGAPHDYTIIVAGGMVTFLVDGQQVHQVAVPALPSLAIWLSVGSTSGAGTIADSMGSVDYQSSGTFSGATLDAGEFAEWQQLVVDASLPQETGITFRARTSTNGTSWSAWSPAATNSPVTLDLPDGQYLQYEIDLSTSGTTTPLVQAVSAGYLASTPPGPASIVISPTSTTLTPGETQQFTAQVLDEDDNPLPGAPVDWEVAAGGGTISAGGLFTAGSTLGTFTDTVVASSGEQSASASVTVTAPAAPEITDIAPSVAVAGDLVTITGANFNSGATIELDATLIASATVVDATTITFTVPQLPAGDYDVVVTNPDQQADSVNDGLTITVPSVPVDIVETTGADFGQGTLSDTEITLHDDGEVRLISSFFDEFDGAALSADWTSGTYGSPGSAGVSGGEASVTNGWIQSSSTFGETTVTARLTFANNGTPYLNFGFGSPGSLDHPWFLFGIPGFDTSRIFARSNVPGAFYLDQGINGYSLNQPHDYSIRRRPGGVDYLIDGDVVASHTISDPATTAPLAVWFSSGGSGQQLDADWFRVDEYPSSGVFTSREIDAGALVAWQSITCDAEIPAGTAVNVRVRTSDDGISWSAWSSNAVLDGDPIEIDVPDGRYVQYELTLSSGDGVTPEVRSVTLSGDTV